MKSIQTTTRRLAFVLCAGSVLVLASTTAQAQADWPLKPVRIVVPLAAGGGNDIIGRHLAEALTKKLGQPVIVENKVGAGGNIGTDYVAKSPPDGYTLLLTATAPIAQATVLYKKLPYDPQADLTMVSDVATPRIVCAVNPDVPARNATELVAWAKANPGKLKVGSWGPGTQPHVVQVFLDKTFNISTLNVPYRGEALVVNDLLGGQVNMTCATVTALRPHIQSAKLRAIAVIGSTRAASLPEVPTFGESGMPYDVLQITGPISLLAPSKTPPDVVNRLGREVAELVQTADLKRKIEATGMEPIGNLPADAAAGYKIRFPVFVNSTRDTGASLD